MIKDLGEIDKPLLIFGGPYSNLQATQRIKEIAEEKGFAPDQIICTGDIIAYCAQPEQTVQLIKEWGVHSIVGNVEIQLREDQDDCDCNFTQGSTCAVLAKGWYPFAKSTISEETKQWITPLPRFISFSLKGKVGFVVHGSSVKTSEYIFKSTPWQRKAQEFERLKVDMIIGGHCGIPFHDVKDNKAWLNAGVIGMPANEGKPRGWYMTLTPKDKEIDVQHHSFAYDNKTASQIMKEHQLPEQYAKTLLDGIWDNCDVLPEQETSEQGKEIVLEKIQF